MVNQEGRPALLDALAPERVVTADVRERLRAGGEPFGEIMAALRSVPPGGVLCVRAIFEPAPLYAVLARQGLTHWTEQLAEDDWLVWFYPAAPDASSATDAAATSRAEGDGAVVLDVRGLEPPEPMVQTLAALEQLAADTVLVQINSRIPKFLLPMLEERGFTWTIEEQGDELVRVFITRKEEKPEVTDRILDVRVIAPRDKHPTIFEWFNGLAAGESFELVNDHDPKPLRYQFEFEHRGEYGWEYLEEGPETWRVRITRTAVAEVVSHPAADGRAPNLVACKVGRR